MKLFVEDSRELWGLVERVQKPTMRGAVSPNELVLEATAGMLYLYRQSSQAYAEAWLPATIYEEGKVILGDLRPLQYCQGGLNLGLNGSTVSIQADFPRDMTLVLSSKSLEYVERRPRPEKLVPIPKAASRVTWAAGGTETGMDYIWLSGSRVACSDKTLVSYLETNPPLLEEGWRVVPVDALMGLAEQAKLGVNGRRVEVVGDNFFYSTTTFEKADWTVTIIPGWERSAEIGRVVVQTEELLQVMRYLQLMSSSREVAQDGLVFVEVKEGRVICEGLPSQTGHGRETLTPVQATEGLAFYVVPKQLIQAVEADKIDLTTIMVNETRHVRVTSNQIVSWLGGIVSGWRGSVFDGLK